jgi:hypothetical protein
VRGFLDGGVFTFKGIPYGQDTGGENRWLPSKPPAPWKDEYPALISPKDAGDIATIQTCRFAKIRCGHYGSLSFVRLIRQVPTAVVCTLNTACGFP